MSRRLPINPTLPNPELTVQPSRLRLQLPGWLNKGFWSILDQGLFSVANFVANILLANWLASEAEYGAFSVAFTYFLLAGIFHGAFLTEPALVFGPDKYRGNLKRYLGALLYGHAQITLLGAIALVGYGLLDRYLWNEPATGAAVIAFGVAAPFMLLLWFMRRTCYIESQPQRAAVGGGLYLLLMMIMLAGLQLTGRLSTVSAIATMGGCSLIASLALMLREKPRIPSVREPFVAGIRADHWKYGRWAAVTGLATYIPCQIYFPILDKMHGLESAGTLRAVNNLVMPLLQAIVAINMLLLPMLVRARGTPRFHKLTFGALMALCVAPIAFAMLLGVFADPVLQLVYRGRYGGDPLLVWLIGFQPVVVGAYVVFHLVLQSHQQPKYVFYASIAAAVASLTVGVWMTQRWGVSGAAAAMLVGFGVNAVVAAFYCWRVVWSGRTPAIESTGISIPTAEPEVL